MEAYPDRHGRADPHAAKTGGQAAAVAASQFVIDFARRVPFEHRLVGEQDAPERASDGVETEKCRIGQTGQIEGDLLEMPESRAGNGRQVLPEEHLVRLAHQVEAGGAQRRDEQDADDGGGPQAGRRHDRPAEQQDHHQRGGNEAAPQVVGEFPLRQGGKRIRLAVPILIGTGAGDAPAQPAGQLPVATNPAVAPADVGAVTGRIVFEQLHIAQRPSI